MTTTADIKLLFSNSRGMSIPWCFADEILEGSIIGGKEQWTCLNEICDPCETWEEAASKEGYWDAWHEVLDSVVLRDDKGHVYTLYQDGDVWLIPCGEHVKWVPDEDCEVDDEDLDDDFCSDLDDVYPAVTLLGVKYDFSRVLFSVDECAYNQEYSNWLDSELTDKQLVEIDGKYYRVSAKEPEEYSGYWFEQYMYEGHYEWKIALKEEVKEVPSDFFDDKFDELLDNR